MGRFISASIVGFLLFVAVGYGDSQETRTGRAAKAMVRVHLTEPAVLSPKPYNDAEYRAYRNFTIAVITSDFVLQAALDLEEYALPSIPAIANSEERLEWLRDRLEVRALKDSPLVEIRCFDDDLPDDALCKIVDAVVEAYIREVVDQDQRQRLSSRNEMERALSQRRQQSEKMEKEYYEVLREIGQGDSKGVATKRAVLIAKLREVIRASEKLQDRLDDEFIRFQMARLQAASLDDASTAEPEPDLSDQSDDSHAVDAIKSNKSDAASESELPAPAGLDDRENESPFAFAKGKPPNERRYLITRQVLGKRMEDLHVKQEALEKELEQLSAPNHEAIARNRELETLAEFVKTVEQELALFDVNLLARPRVMIMQRATIEEVD